MAHTLDVLRSYTRPLHAQLEASFNLQQAIGTRSAYRTLLEHYVGLYRPFDRIVDSQPQTARDLIGWPGSRRTSLLELDLERLGVHEEERATLPESCGLPAIDDLDALLGAMYVIEGSALGGQIICRQIQSNLQLDERHGAAFFFGDGPGTGATWKRFTNVLETHVSDPEKAAVTACAMFQSFEDWLTGPAVA